jgi:hypothetical protein
VSLELLREQAGEFAQVLTELLNGTVTTGAHVAVFVIADTGHAIVAPSRSNRMSSTRSDGFRCRRRRAL